VFHSVIIPTRGRADSCWETVACVFRQSVKPDQVLVSAVDAADVDNPMTDERVRVIFGQKGLTRQRNRAIDQLDPSCEIVTMLDDDVELPEDYLANVQRLFSQRPDVVICFGDVRNCPGATRDQARQILGQWSAPNEFHEGPSGLGCSMNIRRSVLNQVRFDERLPLYGWLEDADFSARCRGLGKIGFHEAARTVHLVEQRARLSGYRFGYSQVMNPFYLWRKNRGGTLIGLLREHWLKVIGSNLVGLVRRDPMIDRWGRLRGNFLAFRLILRGRVEPELIERL
jgi:GT2 family glycosyltransferase